MAPTRGSKKRRGNTIQGSRTPAMEAASSLWIAKSMAPQPARSFAAFATRINAPFATIREPDAVRYRNISTLSPADKRASPNAKIGACAHAKSNQRADLATCSRSAPGSL